MYYNVYVIYKRWLGDVYDGILPAHPAVEQVYNFRSVELKCMSTAFGISTIYIN